MNKKPNNIVTKSTQDRIQQIEMGISLILQKIAELDEMAWEMGDYLYSNLPKKPEPKEAKPRGKSLKNKKTK